MKHNRKNMNKQHPLIKGGQGRSSDSLYAGANYLMWLIFGLAAWAIVYGLYCLFTWLF